MRKNPKMSTYPRSYRTPTLPAKVYFGVRLPPGIISSLRLTSVMTGLSRQTIVAQALAFYLPHLRNPVSHTGA